jgi:hypothetical protein
VGAVVRFTFKVPKRSRQPPTERGAEMESDKFIESEEVPSRKRSPSFLELDLMAHKGWLRTGHTEATRDGERALIENGGAEK